MARALPVLVNQLCHLHGGWIVGSAAKPEVDLAKVKDYDVLIPFSHWKEAAVLVPEAAEVNSFGGWKCPTPEGVSVDVWPGDLAWVLTNAAAEWAWHPQSGARWMRCDG